MWIQILGVSWARRLGFLFAQFLTMGQNFRRCDLEESELIFSLGSLSRTYVTAHTRLYTK
jgi:hypothetical protein